MLRVFIGWQYRFNPNSMVDENPESNPAFSPDLFVDVTVERIKSSLTFNIEEVTLPGDHERFPGAMQLRLVTGWGEIFHSEVVVSPETGRVYLTEYNGFGVPDKPKEGRFAIDEFEESFKNC